MHRSISRSATTALTALALIASGVIAAAPAGADLAESHTFAGWTQRIQGATDATFVADESIAVDGEVSLRLDNATARGPNLYAELFQDVHVTTGATYDMSGWFRGEDLPEAAAVLVTSNDWIERIPLPQGTFDWQQITWEITIPAGETVRSWRILLEDIGSLWIDDLSMVEAGTSANLLANPSFEDFESDPGSNIQIGVPIDSLVLTPGVTTIPVTAQAAEVAYRVDDIDGVTAQQGSLDTASGTGTLDVADLDPGYYALHLESTGVDASSLDTSFAIVADLPPTAVGTESPFGVSYHPPEFPTRPELAAALGPLGTSYGRIDYPWEQVELAPGEYTFPSYLEDQVEEQIANGIRPLLILDYRNPLYDDNLTPSTPEGLAGYGNYAAAVAEHFGTSVDYEIYNEFNHHFNDGLCGRTPECYFELMVAATDRIRAVVPDATLAGPTIVGDIEWLTRFAQIGGLDHIDALTFHPYNHPDGPDVYQPEMIAAAVQLVEDYAEPGHEVEVWVTETGWPVREGYVSEQDQANYIARYMAGSIAAGADRTYWYEVTDAGTDAGDLEQVFGMMRHFSTAVPTYAPRPGYVAYHQAVRYLADAEFIAQDNLADGAYGYAFGGGSAGPVRVLWATQAHDVTVSATEELTVVDAYGRSSQVGPGDITVSLTERPVYLLGEVDGVTPAPESVYSISAPAVLDLDSPVEIEVTVDHRSHTGSVDGPVRFVASTGEQILVPARAGELTSATLAIAATGSPGERELTVAVQVGGETVMQQRVVVTVADHRSTFRVEPTFSSHEPLDAAVGITITNASDAADLEVTEVAWVVEGTDVGAADSAVSIPLGDSATLTAMLPDAEIWHSYPFSATITFADGVVREVSGSLAYNPVLAEGEGTPVDLSDVGAEVVLTEASTGPSDLSGTLQLSRTDDALVLLASVTDDVHDNTLDPANMWRADSIQMAFSPVLPSQAASYVELGAGLGAQGAAVQRFSGSGGAVPEATVSIERDDEAGITSYRVELPWSVTGVDPDARTFGFSVLVNDADGGDRTGYLEWGSGIGATKNPSQYQPMRVLESGTAPADPQPAQVYANAASYAESTGTVVAVYARNDDTAPVDIRFTLATGATVKFEDVAPGSAVYHRFSVACDLDAGSATVATYVVREAGPAHRTASLPYDAQACATD